jgi:hypothetical protein
VDKGRLCNETEQDQSRDLKKKACNSDRKQLFFQQVDDFSVKMEHATLISLCLIAKYSLVWVSQIPSDTFLIKKNSIV